MTETVNSVCRFRFYNLQFTIYNLQFTISAFIKQFFILLLNDLQYHKVPLRGI